MGETSHEMKRGISRRHPVGVVVAPLRVQVFFKGGSIAVLLDHGVQTCSAIVPTAGHGMITERTPLLHVFVVYLWGQRLQTPVVDPHHPHTHSGVPSVADGVHDCAHFVLSGRAASAVVAQSIEGTDNATQLLLNFGTFGHRSIRFHESWTVEEDNICGYGTMGRSSRICCASVVSLEARFKWMTGAPMGLMLRRR